MPMGGGGDLILGSSKYGKLFTHTVNKLFPWVTALALYGTGP